MMDTTPPHLAPEGRHVYSTRNTPNTLPHLAPEGRQVNREARKLEREHAKLDP